MVLNDIEIRYIEREDNEIREILLDLAGSEEWSTLKNESV
jgi:hypothetical protein